ncbi:hypothetical protein P9847_13360 [Paenibacillus chibensis]|uniref:Uncharacterized protein n=1 Tax=Paenibacillus chibensis TaxID=59846 RepID=A0ABU6PTS3_9BACL|nr:hypothetical protein [Paenibacillus chibensis]
MTNRNGSEPLAASNFKKNHSLSQEWFFFLDYDADFLAKAYHA